MIVVIGSGFLMIRGSAIIHPETSVQFSYRLAFTALATIEPVISEPPLENVLIVPSSSAPKNPGITARSTLSRRLDMILFVTAALKEPS